MAFGVWSFRRKNPCFTPVWRVTVNGFCGGYIRAFTPKKNCGRIRCVVCGRP